MTLRIILFISGFLFTGLLANGQDKDSIQVFKKKEIKTNLLYDIVSFPELTYERAINQSSSLGLSVGIDASDDEDRDYKYIIVPYYRYYFGKKPFAGYFVEGNLGINRSKGKLERLSMGIGAATGAKFIIKGDYIAEIFVGLGKNIFYEEDDPDEFLDLDLEVYPHAGISIGKRF